jgi:hypothetical protein
MISIKYFNVANQGSFLFKYVKYLYYFGGIGVLTQGLAIAR